MQEMIFEIEICLDGRNNAVASLSLFLMDVWIL
jgi:hypothetical protein